MEYDTGYHLHYEGKRDGWVAKEMRKREVEEEKWMLHVSMISCNSSFSKVAGYVL
jgi:hypothetical protein